MPTLRRLEYLVAIAEHGNFHRAAKAVNVSQPTLSQQLKLLETDLGITLIDRAFVSVRLTPAGRDIVDRARRIGQEVADMKRAARLAREDGSGGILRFGVSPTIGPYLLPEIVARLSADRPSLRIQICEGLPDEQIGELASGGIDVLLTPLPLPLPTDALHVERLFHEPLHIVAPFDHALCRHRQLGSEQLAGHGVLALDVRHPLTRQVADICGALNMVRLRDYEGTSLDSIYQMTASGLGLAVLPELYLRSNAGAAGGVQRLRIRGFAARREIALLWRKETPFNEICALAAKRIQARGKTILKGAPPE